MGFKLKEHLPYIGIYGIFIKYAAMFLLGLVIPFTMDADLYMICSWVGFTFIFDGLILMNLKRLTSNMDDASLSVFGMNTDQLKRFLGVTAFLRTIRTFIVINILALSASKSVSFNQFIHISFFVFLIELAIRYAMKLRQPLVGGIESSSSSSPRISPYDFAEKARENLNSIRPGSIAWYGAEAQREYTRNLLDDYKL